MLLHIPRMNTSNSSRVVFAAVFLFSAMDASASAPPVHEPSPATTEAFDGYVRSRESDENDELARKKNFLWIDNLPEQERLQHYALLKGGEILIRCSPACASRDCCGISGGFIHDWVGIVFVPGVSLEQTLTTLQNYDRDADYYRPQVLRAKLLSHSGNVFHVFLRLKQTYAITVVLDTEYEIQYLTIDDVRAAAHSHSTRIAEVENPASPQERSASPQDDRGFLWRLNSYWHFYQADGGVYIQCNAVSLTRDVPTGVGWLVGPFIENIPRESLRFTLTATRQALLERFRPNAGK